MMNVICEGFDLFEKAVNRFFIEPGRRGSFGSCGKDVRIGRKCQFEGSENIFVGNDVRIGMESILWTTRARIFIGNHVMTGPRVTVITGDHRTDILDKPMTAIVDTDKLPENDQDVFIGNDVWIGCNVTILKGVRIADGCVVAAGSVVTRKVEPDFSIWGGVPARQLGSRIS